MATAKVVSPVLSADVTEEFVPAPEDVLFPGITDAEVMDLVFAQTVTPAQVMHFRAATAVMAQYKGVFHPETKIERYIRLDAILTELRDMMRDEFVWTDGKGSVDFTRTVPIPLKSGEIGKGIKSEIKIQAWKPPVAE